MAADQRKKKRVNASSLVGCTAHENIWANRKKRRVHQYDLTMRPIISLEWNKRKKSVVPKKEQIGLSRRHLIPYVEPGSRGHGILADVIPVPVDIFELDNLSDVFTYEVWQSHLSDEERSFLSQFLPNEIEPDKAVQDLLSVDSLHFGNPFIKWGASLCLGELHPDTVLRDEQSRKADKEAYYSFLAKYHNDMIDNLQKWNEKWSSYEDSDVDITQNIWSSTKHGEKSMPALDARFFGTEENHAAAPDSCSWENSEIAYSSENPNLGTMHGESHRRRDFLKKISDRAKYMSYIKVSGEQYERVKSSMTYASNGIQTRSLNNVLSSFDVLNVQPFAKFEEEESNKLHEYWVKLATKDVPVRFDNWRKIKVHRKEQMQSLVEEIRQKVEIRETMEEEKDVSSSTLMELSDGEGELPASNTFEEVEQAQSDDMNRDQSGNEESIHKMATESEDIKEERNGYIFEKHTHNNTERNEGVDGTNYVFVQDHSDSQVSSLNNSSRSTMLTSSSPGFLQDQQQINSLDSNPRTTSMEMESHGDGRSAKDEDPKFVSGYFVNTNNMDIPLNQRAFISSYSDVWPVGDAHNSYYQSIAPSSGYASTHELSIGHPPFMQAQAVQMLNLETIQQDRDARKDLVHRQTDDKSFFSTYPNQHRSDLLHSLLMGQGNSSYHQLQNHSGIDFQPVNDIMMETTHFSGQFRELVHPPFPNIDVRQKRPNDGYLHHQNIQDNLYSGGQFAVPRQEDLAVKIHDWGTGNRVRIPVSCQPHLNGVELGQNWYATENGNRNGLPLLVNMNSGGNSDQTLFSIVSECNELPQVSYNAGRLIHSSSNLLARAAPNPANCINRQDGSGGIKMNPLGWMGMGLAQQNSGLQEPIGKPFLRSWNQ